MTEKTAEDVDHNLLEAVTMEYDDANRLKTYNGQSSMTQKVWFGSGRYFCALWA